MNGGFPPYRAGDKKEGFVWRGFRRQIVDSVESRGKPFRSPSTLTTLAPKTILLTGASGFIGRHTAVGLLAAGYRVRALSRDPVRARHHLPWLTFVHGDLVSAADVQAAMHDCTAAIYLYHGLGSVPDYPEREAQTALTFRRIAATLGLERIVYLGGVAPQGRASKHLSSRLRTGEILRTGTTPTLELRASMVIGHQSQSFSLVRDLVTTMPILALPSWLDHESCPIAIDDVATALTLALELPLIESAWFDLPGPECLSHRKLLAVLSAPLGTRLLESRLPWFSPNHAALALSLLSRVPSRVSRELVQGLTAELVPGGRSFWDWFEGASLRSIKCAIADAFADELTEESPSPETRRRIEETVQRLRKLVRVTGD